MSEKRKVFTWAIIAAFAALSIGASAVWANSPNQTTTNAPAAGEQTAQAPDNDAVEHEAQDEADDATENEADEQSEPAENQASEADESAALASQVAVSEEQARSAALAEVSGTVTGVELGDEDGTIIYEVSVDDGTQVTGVKVDANTGTVLGTDLAED